MKRLSPSLCALAVATGAGLLFAGSSSAQTYNTYTNNFEASGNPGAAISYNAAASYNGAGYSVTTGGSNANTDFAGYVDNYDGTFLLSGDAAGASTGYYVDPKTGGDAEYAYAVTTQPIVGSPVNGAVTFSNGGGTITPGTPSTLAYTSTIQAHQGTQSVLESFQQSTTTGGFQRFITANNLAAPTVDLGGTVSFWMYVDTGAGTGTTAAPNTTSLNSTSAVQVNIGVNQSSTVSVSDPNALGKYGSGATAPYSEYVYDSTISGGFPKGGKQVNAGSWQQVTFNLASDPMTFVAGAATPSRSGLGYLYDINVTPVNPTTGLQANASQVNQVYNIYFDDLTITAAPEPSAWLGLAAGGAMLLGLGLVSARRRRGANAA